MQTDEERRKVAARLRDTYMAYTHVESVEFCDAYDVQCALGLEAEDEWFTRESVDHLADLIDRPTCHISETDHEFEDSVRCDRCQMTFNRPWEPFKFCPNCGAEVVNDA